MLRSIGDGGGLRKTLARLLCAQGDLYSSPGETRTAREDAMSREPGSLPVLPFEFSIPALADPNACCRRQMNAVRRQDTA